MGHCARPSRLTSHKSNWWRLLKKVFVPWSLSLFFLFYHSGHCDALRLVCPNAARLFLIFPKKKENFFLLKTKIEREAETIAPYSRGFSFCLLVRADHRDRSRKQRRRAREDPQSFSKKALPRSTQMIFSFFLIFISYSFLSFFFISVGRGSRRTVLVWSRGRCPTLLVPSSLSPLGPVPSSSPQMTRRLCRFYGQAPGQTTPRLVSTHRTPT